MGDFLPGFAIEKKILICALLIAKKNFPKQNFGKLHRDLFDYSAVIFPM